MSIFRLTILVAALAITGCGVSPRSLEKPVSITRYTLLEDYKWLSRKGSSGDQIQLILSAGDYVATYKDSGGVYHLGPQACLRQVQYAVAKGENPATLGANVFLHHCGVYVPNDVKDPMALYVVLPQIFPPLFNGAAPTPAIQPVPGASPALMGAGAGIGMAVGAGLSNLEDGNLMKAEYNLDPAALRKVLVLQQRDQGAGVK